MVMMSPAFYAYELATQYLQKDNIRIVSLGTVHEEHKLPDDFKLQSWSDVLKDSNIRIKAAASDYLTSQLLNRTQESKFDTFELELDYG